MKSLSERLGGAISELDIDFSRFTLAGWAVSIVALSLGFLVAWSVYWAVVGRIVDDRGPALLFGLTMIGTTVLVFLSLRAVLAWFRVPMVSEHSREDAA